MKRAINITFWIALAICISFWFVDYPDMFEIVMTLFSAIVFTVYFLIKEYDSITRLPTKGNR